MVSHMFSVFIESETTIYGEFNVKNNKNKTKQNKNKNKHQRVNENAQRNEQHEGEVRC